MTIKRCKNLDKTVHLTHNLFIAFQKESQMTIMYDLTYCYGSDSRFISAKVSPIEVLETFTIFDKRSIRARDTKGDIFTGDYSDYFETEEAAKAEVVQDLRWTIENNHQKIESLISENVTIRKFLENL
jgi:hypothetical protein